MDDADLQQAVREDLQWEPRVKAHTPRHLGGSCASSSGMAGPLVIVP
jgi:hypothetical protein